jgi:aminoglycoside phosphotransferase (APT) family kinase protein
MADEEVPLAGGDWTPGVVRIGDTVRRPARPFTATVQAYLAHLHSAGFTGAPVPLGFDDQGREMLSYVPGDVPLKPLPPEAAGDDVLAALARLIRQLHDAARGWVPPPDAVWMPVTRPGGPAPVDGDPELVGHRDYCVGNVVFRQGLPAAFIDFDLARPTSRLYELANALFWWGPLQDPADRDPALVHADVLHRAAVFADAYGMPDGLRRELVPTAQRMAHRFHVNTRWAAERDPVFFRDVWETSEKYVWLRMEAWLEDEGQAITARLLSPSSPLGPAAG